MLPVIFSCRWESTNVSLSQQNVSSFRKVGLLLRNVVLNIFFSESFDTLTWDISVGGHICKYPLYNSHHLKATVVCNNISIKKGILGGVCVSLLFSSKLWWWWQSNLPCASPRERNPTSTVAIVVNNFHSVPNIRSLAQPHLAITITMMFFSNYSNNKATITIT